MPILSGRISVSHSENSPLYVNSSMTHPLLSLKEIELAIEMLINRMDHIDSICDNNFPLFSPDAAGHWVTSQGGSWIGGFWSGWWWLRAHVTKSRSDLVKAGEICRRLSPKLDVDSINRSFVFWYGSALGSNWFGDMNAQTQVKSAITAIAATYNPELECFPLGAAMGGGEKGERSISIDSLAALIQLLGSGADEQHEIQTMLRRHVDTILGYCCDTQNQGAFHALASYSRRKFTPLDNAGVWSRGQAWAMLGLSRAAARWGEPYVTYAQTACEYWKNSRTDSLPSNYLNGSDKLLDPSSAVIASLAMISLADQIQEGDQWFMNAHKLITDVIYSQYFTGFQGNEVQGEKQNTDSGIFQGCCYRTSPGKEELVETPWGSFFLMAALCALARIIKPEDV
ncbi:glucuronyl hydrolase [Nitrosomonas aestuarii]|uniref:glucuronyl hydrolase n=1 Tax=Nitrosomonas aestuarii TaxID=52441 RepID=UPI000D46A1D6|nr:glucuronyl hydrolase [Nitrosomonas aestuarii]PTN11159.1 unsaturated chondroitin disaccharide hydrolase [Nitrosomonas aestuarii]